MLVNTYSFSRYSYRKEFSLFSYSREHSSACLKYTFALELVFLLEPSSKSYSGGWSSSFDGGTPDLRDSGPLVPTSAVVGADVGLLRSVGEFEDCCQRRCRINCSADCSKAAAMHVIGLPAATTTMEVIPLFGLNRAAADVKADAVVTVRTGQQSCI